MDISVNQRKIISVNYIIFLTVFYMNVFEFALMQISHFISYWDEIYSLLLIPLLIYKRKSKVNRTTILYIMILLSLCITGLIGNFFNSSQKFIAIYKDILINLKFFMSIGTTILLFEKMNIEKYKKKIKAHLKIALLFLFITLIITYILDMFCGIYIFNTGETRFGVKAQKLMFGHSTGLASVSFFLMLLYIVFYKKKTIDYTYILISIILVLSSLRYKAIASVILFLCMFYIVIIKNSHVKLQHILLCVPFIVYIAWDEFYGYFLNIQSRMFMARGALTFTSFKILKDYFPFGTGFATFGSAASAQYYSDIYNQYKISDVYGLTKDYADLATDQYWPMIAGQFGVIGLALIIILVILLLIKICKLYGINKNKYLASLSAIIYLLVSSTTESAFANPLSIPLGFIIGICFIKLPENKSIDKI